MCENNFDKVPISNHRYYTGTSVMVTILLTVTVIHFWGHQYINHSLWGIHCTAARPPFKTKGSCECSQCHGGLVGMLVCDPIWKVTSRVIKLYPKALKQPQKNTKVRPAVDNGSGDRPEKNLFVLKSGSTTPNPLNRDPESTEQNHGNYRFRPNSAARFAPPEIGWFFFFRPISRVWGTLRPNSAARFVPPEIGWNPSQPQDLGWKIFFSS